MLFRSLLKVMGYKSDVFEFVSGDHTGRNLMIRAVRNSGGRGKQSAIAEELLREYRHTCQIWGVTPALFTRLKLGTINESD